MRESTRRQLRRLGVRPRKALGQHFLVNEGAADAIVAAALAEDPDVVVEIGPGLGVLTRRLVRSSKPVVAIEKDRAMASEVARIGDEHPNLEVRYADVLEADLSELTAGGHCVAVGNIPYQITSPLLEKLLTCQPPFAAIVLMVQREVGERLAAEPGTSEYGALTLLARFYAHEPEVVAELAPGSFHPPPKVHSVVLKVIPRQPPVEEGRRRELLFAVVKAAFGQRRKQLPNALSGAPELEIDKSQAREALIRAGIATERRGETLSLEEFATLTEAVEEVANE
ncbi:MAG: 16S rRNA (adenine(1518)-N(6)/adenine(1519)-N(6))-dimethyltransferase RsmA [Armatimonadota bacterium]|nr:16S rRNA (adenine(1518)-N(6)/adenine(1519)-N(6))-dimethyltransferase RsmA [Armatimonadota bacterium]